jgi:hypothetical protein
MWSGVVPPAYQINRRAVQQENARICRASAPQHLGHGDAHNDRGENAEMFNAGMATDIHVRVSPEKRKHISRAATQIAAVTVNTFRSRLRKAA